MTPSRGWSGEGVPEALVGRVHPLVLPVHLPPFPCQLGYVAHALACQPTVMSDPVEHIISLSPCRVDEA